MKWFIFLIIVTIIFAVASLHFVQKARVEPDTKQLIQLTWAGYKKLFINNGMVVRTRENDTVSEGQAYAMLRAVFMDDRNTFEQCLNWTLNNLSRKEIYGDNLLAWRFKDGKVYDYTSASDADIDYALSLVFAYNKWGDDRFSVLAKNVLADILSKETHRFESGALYLMPWSDLKKDLNKFKRIAQNPSYYSPAHFRIFYKFSGDRMWAELLDTSYDVIINLQDSFSDVNGVGLLPDWCTVDYNGYFSVLPGKSPSFGWEAVRIPFRVALDYFLHDEPRAHEVLKKMAAFIEQEIVEKKVVFSEYTYKGIPEAEFESPLFQAAYYITLKSVGSSLAGDMLIRVRQSIKEQNGFAYVESKDAYYVNSLAWLAELI